MIVVLPIVFGFGILLLWALYAEEVEGEPDVRPAPPWPVAPTPADIARPRFPLAPIGYDRARVEDHLTRAAELVADLQARLAAVESPPAGPPAAPPADPLPAAPPPEDLPRPEGAPSQDADPSV